MTDTCPKRIPLPRDEETHKLYISDDAELVVVTGRRDYNLKLSEDTSLDDRTRFEYEKRARFLDDLITDFHRRRGKALKLQEKLRTKAQEARVSLITNHTPEGITVTIPDAKAFEASMAEVGRLYETMKDNPNADHLVTLSKITSHLDAQKVFLTAPKPDIEELQRFATFLIDYYARSASAVERDHPKYVEESGEIMRLYGKWQEVCQREATTVDPPYGWAKPDNWDEALVLWYIVPMLKKIMGRD